MGRFRAPPTAQPQYLSLPDAKSGGSVAFAVAAPNWFELLSHKRLQAFNASHLSKLAPGPGGAGFQNGGGSPNASGLKLTLPAAACGALPNNSLLWYGAIRQSDATYFTIWSRMQTSTWASNNIGQFRVDVNASGTVTFAFHSSAALDTVTTTAAVQFNRPTVIAITVLATTVVISINGVSEELTPANAPGTAMGSNATDVVIGNAGYNYLGQRYAVAQLVAATRTRYSHAAFYANPWALLATLPRRKALAPAAGGGTTISALLGTADASGFTASVNASKIVAAGLGTASASGFLASINASTNITATLGTATASGFDATVTFSSSGTTINATMGTAAASGFDASFNFNTTVSATLGTAQAVGFDASVVNGSPYVTVYFWKRTA